MLDELIAARTARLDHGRRIALAVRRTAWLVVVPTSVLMLLGLITFLLQAGPGTKWRPAAVLPLGELLSRAAVSPIGALSAALLALALLPVINVLYILADSLLHRRRADAVAAAVIAIILLIGAFLGSS